MTIYYAEDGVRKEATGSILAEIELVAQNYVVQKKQDADRAVARTAALAKLAALGLTTDDLAALGL